MVSYQGYLLVVVGLLMFVIEGGLALSCWKCSTQTDANCRDHFNTTRIMLNERRMDSYAYGNLQPVRTDPHLARCEEMHTSTFSQFKNVCLKRVYTVPNGLREIHRECHMVRRDLKSGNCPDDITNIRPKELEFCGTCEYDGCNSASTNSIVFMLLVPSVLLFIGQ